MTESTQVTLKNFFIFNSKYGQKEGEDEEKIIFFYPDDISIDSKMKEVGLSEAIIKFIENFSSDSCESLHTEKTRKLFYQPEDDIWVVMTLNIPYGPKGKDVMEGMEYLGSEVRTPIYMAVLRQAYLTSRLFLGPYQEIINSNEGNLKELRQRLIKFFSQYLLKLQLNDCDIIDLFQGVEFLGLDKATYIFTLCTINQVQAKFPMIDYILLLYDEKIIWSGLDPEDVQILYRYVVNSLLPSYLQSKSFLNSHVITAYPASLRFVTGLPATGKVRKVYLTKVRDPGFYDLIVYRVHQATVCILSNSKTAIKEETLKHLDSFLCEKMEKICSEINTYKNQKVTTSDNLEVMPDARYIYFNSMNLATKGTLHEKRIGQPPITKESLRILVDIHQLHLDLLNQGHKTSESLIKSLSDYWVIGRMSNGRQFYVVLERKKTNLLNVSADVNIICEKQLQGIFFHV